MKFQNLVLLSILIHSYTLSVVTGIDIWRIQTAKGYRYCFFLLDYHIDYTDLRVGKQQQQEILEIISKCDNPFVIVEDVGTYTNQLPALRQASQDLYNHYQSLNDGGIKADHICDVCSFLCKDIIAHCHENKIPYYNAECRHFYYCDELPWPDALEDVDEHLQQLALYSHAHPLVSTYYSALTFLRSRVIARDYENLNQLCYHLVNAKIIQKIIEQQPTKTMFVCMGAGHGASLEEDMYALGYEKVGTLGQGVNEEPGEAQEIMKNTLCLKTAFKERIFPLIAAIENNL